jgi:hypothetical protein
MLADRVGTWANLRAVRLQSLPLVMHTGDGEPGASNCFVVRAPSQQRKLCGILRAAQRKWKVNSVVQRIVGFSHTQELLVQPVGT